jgi:hypothetical protein
MAKYTTTPIKNISNSATIKTNGTNGKSQTPKIHHQEIVGYAVSFNMSSVKAAIVNAGKVKLKYF